MSPEEPAADVWDNIVARLNERGIDPIRMGDLTYPQLLCILTDGKSGDPNPEDKAKAVLADFKSGKLSF